MYVKEINNIVMADFFLSDSKLAGSALTDQHFEYLNLYRIFLPLQNYYNCGVYNKNKLIATFIWSYASDTVINIHVYLKSKYQNTKVISHVWNRIKLFLYEHIPSIETIRIMIPKSCRHVSLAALRNGFKAGGCIKNGIIWKERLQDVLIYNYNLIEVKHDGSACSSSR